MTQKVEYDLESFTYIGQITEYQQAIVAKADAPFNTMEELIDYAKTNPLNFADQSAMSVLHKLHRCARRCNLDRHTHQGRWRNGSFSFRWKGRLAWSGGIHNRYGDDMKVLMSMNGGRLLAAPDTFSVAEKYGVSMPSQAVIVAPAGTPSAVVDKIESAMEKATKDADFSDLVTNKLKFPVKFVGAKALAADIVTTAEGLKEVIEKTK